MSSVGLNDDIGASIGLCKDKGQCTVNTSLVSRVGTISQSEASPRGERAVVVSVSNIRGILST